MRPSSAFLAKLSVTPPPSAPCATSTSSTSQTKLTRQPRSEKPAALSWGPWWTATAPLESFVSDRPSFADGPYVDETMLSTAESYSASRNLVPEPVEEVLFDPGQTGTLLTVLVVAVALTVARWRTRGPDVRWVVARCCEHGMTARPEDTTFYLGRAYWLPDGPAPMWRWRKRLFAFMSWNASSATDFFGVPPDRVLELGARIEF